MYDDQHVAALWQLVDAGLGRWSLPATTRVELLALSENATFLLRPPVGPPLVLRVARPGYHTPAELRSELAWSEALRRQGVVRTPASIAGADGETVQCLRLGATARHAILHEHVAGAAPREDGALAERFRALGRITARLHRQARHWPRPAWFVRKRWTVETTIGPAPHWGTWRLASGLSAADAAVLAHAVARIGATLEAYGTAPHRFGLIHADLRLSNLLIDGTELHVIDFDDCGFGWFVADFAAAISFIEDAPTVPGLFAAWCDGYETIAPLAPADRSVVPALVLMRRLQLLGWTRSHAETATVRALGSEFTDRSVALAARFLSGRDPLCGR